MIISGYRKKKAIEGLVEVKQKAINGDYAKDEVEGVCAKWDAALHHQEACYCLVAKFAKTWEHFSGQEYYPIGEGQQDFMKKTSRWTGVNLQLRLSLIDHILSEMEKLPPVEIFKFEN